MKIFLLIFGGFIFCFIHLASLEAQVPLPFSYGPNGEKISDTNMDKYWNGIWQQDTNGWRVQLGIYSDNGNANPTVVISTGSILSNFPGCLMTPNGKFSQFELKDADGNIIKPKQDAGMNLIKGFFPLVYYHTNLPDWMSPTNGSLTMDFPKNISTDIYPRWSEDKIACQVEGFTNNTPTEIGKIDLDRIYSIQKEGDYTLTICPVLYKHRWHQINVSGERLNELLKQYPTNISYSDDGRLFLVTTNVNDKILERVDLPCVTAKIHLVPNEK